MIKRTFIAATVLTLGGTLAGCGGDDEPKAEPSATESTSPSVTESTSSLSPSATATTPEPAWDDKFSPAQLRRYEAARDRWLEFWEAYTDAARTGADTPGLLRMFKKYSVTPLGERSRFLDTYTRGGNRMEVAPEVLWTNANKITAEFVNFNYCLDYTHARITNNGEVSPNDPPLRRLVGVQMQKTSEGWKKAGFLYSGVKACTPTAP